ncbi:hypothetical protein ABT033_00370 [Streptomyces pharetrae]|uniref:hypothetical protein n=1 Tax=Streptomyces pharetrae TaxID=291370 RepID=UPI003356755B
MMARSCPSLVIALEQLQDHGARTRRCRRRLGRTGEQTLTAGLDIPDGDALFRRQAARADAEAKRGGRLPNGRRAAAGVLEVRDEAHRRTVAGDHRAGRLEGGGR